MDTVVTLHVWRMPTRSLPQVLGRMATDRARLRRHPGVRFAKLLGTGTGTGFGPTDVDVTRWAALLVHDPTATPPPQIAAWTHLSDSHARVDLAPISSRGTWSGREPFPANGTRTDGMVLALTRARLKATRAATFWRAIPPVAAALHDAPGLLARFGIGEAPIGWQGTVSVWRSAADLVAFAYRQPEHRAAIARTARVGWYAEELFARFAVSGIMGDRGVLGWEQMTRSDPA
ncbi:monooxygenase [Asanoa sp. WMMD1127]|uniref:monooxygenase n=1 Tax=Asanoa sp. WMMD1127 TaxID=3016107 RepID=UPI0024177021|nr:monooxygenase [Asanoa sp. WMMD1127]MDG4827106.1 monooxygenase [Asanoa sp. WMMD1127]